MNNGKLKTATASLLAMIFFLFICIPAYAGPVNRLTTPPEGWQTNTPAANTFRIKGSNKTFILLSVTNDVYAKYFVLAKDSYGSRAFDPDKTTKFDVEDTNNIAYWLNHQLIDPNSTNKLPVELFPYIHHQQVWSTEACRSNSICPQDYTTTAGVALLSQAEYIQYAPKLGVVDGMSGWGWWLRTARGINADTPTLVQAVQVSALTGQTAASEASFTGAFVRPAFYLHQDFFSSVKLDVKSMGSHVKQALLNNYTKEQMTGGSNPLYTEAEWSQIELEGIIKVSHDRPGGIFEPQSVLFNVYFDLRVQEPKTYLIEYTATGTASLTGSTTVTVHPGATPTEQLDLLGLPNGVYSLQVNVKQGSRVVSSESLPFSVMPNYQSQYDDQHTMFAMATHYALEGRSGPIDTDILVKAGVKVVRDEIQWHKIEKAGGVFDFSRHDWWVDDLVSKGIKIIAVLGYNHPLYNGKSGVVGAEKYGYSTPEELEAYLNYVTKTVEHYKGKVDTFEIWNEPNHGGFWKTTPDAGVYANLVKATSLAIRKVIPDATIIAGAVANQNGYQYLTEMFEHGVYPYIDAMSFHPYIFPYNPDTSYMSKLNSYTSKLTPYGDWKDLYVTEVGWPTSIDSNGVPESVQAAYLVKQFMISASAGLKVSSLYDMRDDGVDPYNLEHNYGVIRHLDFSAKPSLIAVRHLNGVLGNAQFVGETDIGAGLKAYMWRKNGAPVVAAWSTSGTRTLDLGLEESSVSVTDLLGNPVAVSGPLSLGTDPVYISGLSSAWLNARLFANAEKLYGTWLNQWGSQFTQSQGIITAINALRQAAHTNPAAPSYANLTSWMDSHYLQGEAIIAYVEDHTLDLPEAMSMLHQYHKIGLIWESLIAGATPAGTPALTSGTAIASTSTQIEAKLQAAKGGSLPFAEEVLRHARNWNKRAQENAQAGRSAQALAWDRTALKLAGWSAKLAGFEAVEATNLLVNTYPSRISIFEGGESPLQVVVTNTRATPFTGKLRILNAVTQAVLEESEITLGAGQSLSKSLTCRSSDPGFAGANAIVVALVEQDQTVRSTTLPVDNKTKVQASLSSTMEAVSDMQHIGIKLKNVFTQSLSGTVEVTAPEGWQLPASQVFVLQASEEKEILFPVSQVREKPFHDYVFDVTVKDAAGNTLMIKKLPLSFTVVNKAQGEMDNLTYFSGDLSLWKTAFPIYVNPPADPRSVEAWKASNSATKAYWQWDEDYLYTLVQVYDDVHLNSRYGASMWEGDSLQITIDTLNDKSTSYNSNDYEYGFAFDGRGGDVYAWHVASGKSIGDKPSSWLRVNRDDEANLTSYIIRVPLSELTPLTAAESGIFGMNIAINDADTLDRDHYYEFTPGTASSKNPSKYANWKFVEHILTEEPGTEDRRKGAGTTGTLAGGSSRSQ
ncbi:sugar-binding protein [Paenibacillus sp. FSL H7-0331]|uniref:sugar-binding protein n=1 Tax=Paenibacillus sp. FSL H7-0331 TaxID=1920421 RepID=UPI00096DDEBE|nr:sugar-binding protein [Paenibacillus sp. FSL H7-0331]OMF08803.1 hypothetical protein BK127_28095 [Paenibacillus sp. FSL H7-0331]